MTTPVSLTAFIEATEETSRSFRGLERAVLGFIRAYVRARRREARRIRLRAKERIRFNRNEARIASERRRGR